MASASASAATRRERIRAMTLGEIREHGYEQIAQGGPAALSLNGVAKAMGMSGPSMYRYFASRDQLLTTLVTESYEDLADTLEQAATDARRRGPEGRLRAVLEASRNWALRLPHRYRLVFGSTYGSGTLDPERIIPAAHRAMTMILKPLAEIGPAEHAPTVTDSVLARQLTAWGDPSGQHPYDPGVPAARPHRMDPTARHHQPGDRRRLYPDGHRRQPPLHQRDQPPRRATIRRRPTRGCLAASRHVGP